MNVHEDFRRVEDALEIGELNTAETHLEHILDKATESHNRRLVARTGRKLAEVLVFQERPREAAELLTEVCAWLVGHDAPPVTVGLMEVAISAALRADQCSREGLKHLLVAQQLLHGVVPELVEATLRHDLAVLLADTGRFEESVTGFVSAREMFLSGRDRLGVAAANHNLGCVLHDLGSLDDAAEYFQEARNIFLAMDRPEEAAACDQNLGVVYFDLGRLEEAGRRFAVARHRFEASGATQSAGECDYNLGALLEVMGHEDESARYLDRAARVGVEAPLEVGLSGQIPAVELEPDEVQSGSGGSGNVGNASA